MKLLIGSSMFLLSLPFIFDSGGNVFTWGGGILFLVVGLSLAFFSTELNGEGN